MSPDHPAGTNPADTPTAAEPPPTEPPVGVVSTFTGTPVELNPALPVGTAGRYHLLGEIAHGGMGIVYRAHDPAIGRDVAVKVLHERLAGNPAAVGRFLEEARITGQLQHPGIPAVHEIGELPDGRPFLAMKLIRGRTLADLLADPAAGYAAVIPAFEAICQAVGFAHSRGIIHRDLKPANVMVGTFGEVQVMDWGLAKLLGGESEPTAAEASSVIHPTAADELHAATQAGTILGTPAYMPPEQAVGAVDLTDERADVFGLGAVLGFLLTRTPPYVADTGEATRVMAATGQLDGVYARLDACGAEPELVALAKRCLAANRADRPQDAGAVATAVAAFRAAAEERARRAELDRVRADTERAAEVVKAAAEREKRRAQLALAGAAVLLVGLVGIGAWWGQKQIDARERIEFERAGDRARAAAERDQRRERVRENVRDAIERAAGFREQWLWKQADDLLAQAGGQLGPDDDPALAAEVAAARRDTKFVARLHQIRLDKAGTDGKYHNEKAPPAYTAAFKEHGYDVLAGDPATLAARLKASPVWPNLLAALDDWAWTASITPGFMAQPERVWAITTAATGQSRRPGKQITDIRDPAGVMKLIETSPADQLTPSMFSFLAVKAEQLRGDKAAVFEAGIRRFPSDFWMHFELGWAYWFGKPQRLDLALGCFRTAVALRPNVPVAQAFLANAAREQAKTAGKPPESESVAALRERVKQNPNDTAGRQELGWALFGQQKDYTGAAEVFRELARSQPGVADHHYWLGESLRWANRLPEAEAAHREAVRLDPDRPGRAGHLGIILHLSGKNAEAIPQLRRAVGDPADPQVWAYSWLGNAHEAVGQFPEAVAAYRNAVRYYAHNVFDWNRLAEVTFAARDYTSSASAAREAIRLEPANPYHSWRLAIALEALGDKVGAAAGHRQDAVITRDNKNYDHAITCFRRALALTPKDATLHVEIATTFFQKNDLPAADAAARDALRIDRTLAAAHATRGEIARLQRRFPDALASFEMAVTFAPKDVSYRHSRAAALHNLGRLDEAAAGYRDVLRRDPDREQTHLNLGNLLRARGDLDGAAEAYREVIRVNPKLADGYVNLASTRQQQGRLPEAVATWRRTVELFPNIDPYKQQLEYTGRLLATEHALPAILAGTKPQPAADLRAYAFHCLDIGRRYALSFRLYDGQSDLPYPIAYNAARAAVLFAAGRDPSVREVSLDEWYYLMARARAWLAADLADLKTMLADPSPNRQAVAKNTFRHHLADPDLAPVRDPDQLRLIPDPGERAEWERFWAGVRKVADEAGAAWRERAPAPRPAKP